MSQTKIFSISLNPFVILLKLKSFSGDLSNTSADSLRNGTKKNAGNVVLRDVKRGEVRQRNEIECAVWGSFVHLGLGGPVIRADVGDSKL